jgi:GTP-dependent phosphoenolpyruvate carboxykinase
MTTEILGAAAPVTPPGNADAAGRPADLRIPDNVNPHVRKWIEEMIALCQPDALYWCNGSDAERKSLCEQGVNDGTFIRLNPEKLPGCYLHRSNPNDVARSEHLTFICTPSQDMAGVTNNWMESKQAYGKLRGLFSATTTSSPAACTASAT